MNLFQRETIREMSSFYGRREKAKMNRRKKKIEISLGIISYVAYSDRENSFLKGKSEMRFLTCLV